LQSKLRGKRQNRLSRCSIAVRCFVCFHVDYADRSELLSETFVSVYCTTHRQAAQDGTTGSQICENVKPDVF
jgi:hypothetical protein